MSQNSKIEWTDDTWNPTTGCTKVSEACTHCYIDRTPPFRMAHRRFVNGHIPLEFHAERLDKPLQWKKPRKIFVNSLSDLFHRDVPDQYIVEVFTTMYEAQWHTFQLLTKRPERMQSLLTNPRFPWAIGCLAWNRLHQQSPEKAALVTREDIIRDVMSLWPLPNVWLGVTAENQARVDERIPLLLQAPAAVRFISAEPLLGPVEFSDVSRRADAVQMLGRRALSGIDWVITGGESGPHARPTHPDWVRSMRDQCQAAGVPFFFKQWGEWKPADEVDGNRTQLHYRVGDPRGPVDPEWHEWPDGWFSAKVGKKAAGRRLDGQEWSEFPIKRGVACESPN